MAKTEQGKFCDLSCKHARWPDSKDLSGACRTFQALWCKKLKRVVHKHGPCQLARQRRGRRKRSG